MTAVLSIVAAVTTNGMDDDALSRVDAAASEAAMRNGVDNDALLRVLSAAMGTVKTNGTDDDILRCVHVIDVVIVTMSTVGE